MKLVYSKYVYTSRIANQHRNIVFSHVHRTDDDREKTQSEDGIPQIESISFRFFFFFNFIQSIVVCAYEFKWMLAAHSHSDPSNRINSYLSTSIRHLSVMNWIHWIFISKRFCAIYWSSESKYNHICRSTIGVSTHSLSVSRVAQIISCIYFSIWNSSYII